MTLWIELCGFSVDLVFLVLSYNDYSFFRDTVNFIEKGLKNGINPSPELVSDENPCAIVTGTVTSLNNQYVKSIRDPAVKGVVQTMNLIEHDSFTNATGMWVDRTYMIHESTNSVPFTIQQDNYVVQVQYINDSFILDLDTVFLEYTPLRLGIIDSIVNFFTGVRERGIVTSELILREGTIITGVGELSVVNGVKHLIPPANGYILTTSSIPKLLEKVNKEKTVLSAICLVFGVIAAVFVGLLAKRGIYWVINKINDIELSRRLDEARRLRRIAARDPVEIPEDQRCVVCKNNPREIILLPCGHICLCEECGLVIEPACPICRATVTSKHAVFF